MQKKCKFCIIISKEKMKKIEKGARVSEYAKINYDTRLKIIEMVC